MNSTLELRLKDCLAEAERQGAPDAFMVLHLLLGNYHEGSQRKFAQHCARFSPMAVKASVTDDDTPVEPDFPLDWGFITVNDYHN